MFVCGDPLTEETNNGSVYTSGRHNSWVVFNLSARLLHRDKRETSAKCENAAKRDQHNLR